MLSRSLLRVLNAGPLAGLVEHALWRFGPGRGRCYSELLRPLLELTCREGSGDWAVALPVWALVACVIAFPAAWMADQLRRTGSRGVAILVAAVPLGLATGFVALGAARRIEAAGVPMRSAVAAVLAGIVSPVVIVALPSLRASLAGTRREGEGSPRSPRGRP